MQTHTHSHTCSLAHPHPVQIAFDSAHASNHKRDHAHNPINMLYYKKNR